MKHILIFSSLFLISSCVKPVALDSSVLDDAKRPAEERAQDDSRKAIDVYTFIEVQPGMTVADLWPGGGYNTHLLSRLMGNSGRVFCMMGFYGSGRYDMLDKINKLMRIDKKNYDKMCKNAQTRYKKYFNAYRRIVAWQTFKVLINRKTMGNNTPLACI